MTATVSEPVRGGRDGAATQAQSWLVNRILVSIQGRRLGGTTSGKFFVYLNAGNALR